MVVKLNRPATHPQTTAGAWSGSWPSPSNFRFDAVNLSQHTFQPSTACPDKREAQSQKLGKSQLRQLSPASQDKHLDLAMSLIVEKSQMFR